MDYIGIFVRQWLLPVLLIAAVVFSLTTGYGESLNDGWIGAVLAWLVAGVLIWLMTRDSKRRRAERLPEQSEDGSTVSETAAADDERWTVHLPRVGAFFAVPLAVNVVLSAAHGDPWGWSSFSFGLVSGVLVTLWYYGWPRLRGSIGRLR